MEVDLLDGGDLALFDEAAELGDRHPDVLTLLAAPAAARSAAPSSRSAAPTASAGSAATAAATTALAAGNAASKAASKTGAVSHDCVEMGRVF